MTYHFAEVVFLIFVGTLQVCLAVKCYACYKGDPRDPTMQKVLQVYSDVLVDLPFNEFCGDPFDDDTEKHVDKENCEMCGKIKVETGEKQYVARMCYSECRASEGSQHGIDVKIACCRKNSCNLAAHQYISITIVLVTSAMAYMLTQA